MRQSICNDTSSTCPHPVSIFFNLLCTWASCPFSRKMYLKSKKLGIANLHSKGVMTFCSPFLVSHLVTIYAISCPVKSLNIFSLLVTVYNNYWSNSPPYEVKCCTPRGREGVKCLWYTQVGRGGGGGGGGGRMLRLQIGRCHFCCCCCLLLGKMTFQNNMLY